jgi:hypothetical protein
MEIYHFKNKDGVGFVSRMMAKRKAQKKRRRSFKELLCRNKHRIIVVIPENTANFETMSPGQLVAWAEVIRG